MSLENMKFIVKVYYPLGTCEYWEGVGENGDTTLSLSEATIFTLGQLTEEDKAELRRNRKFTRIIPVGGLK